MAQKGEKFSKTTKRLAWTRQKGACGYCGEDLLLCLADDGEDSELPNAHHIDPFQCGGLDLPENCVYLCYRCHPAMHGNYAQYKYGPVPPKEYFPHFDG